MRKFSIIFLSLLVYILGFSHYAISAEKVALVIGNSNYKNKDLSLKNPGNDADDMTKVLKSIGFDVIKLKDGTLQQMEESVDSFASKLNGAKIGIFYYSGHGVQVKGSNYLIPIEANLKSESDSKYKSLDVGLVLGRMEDAGIGGNKVNIVILDACRNNPFKGFRSMSRGLASMDAPKGTIIAFATSPAKTAEDGNGRNGTYTKHLLRNLGNPKFHVNEVFRQTGLRVMEDTKEEQTPWTSSTPIKDIYLASGSVVVETPSQVSTTMEAMPDTGSLIVKTVPLNADIYINGTKVGTDNVLIENLPVGNMRVMAVKDGFKQLEKGIVINKGKETKLTLILDKIEPVATKTIDRVTTTAATTTVEQQTITVASSSKSIKNSIGMEFVQIPAGSFMMGSPESEPGRDSDETLHKVTLTKGFYMQITEVTQGQWKAIMGNNPSHFKNCGNECPVEKVSWHDVQNFIEKLNQKEGISKYRLPTEAEWEYASRAGSESAFANGSITQTACEHDPNLDKMGWYCGNADSKTHSVAQKESNNWGLYDMHGNVWEWCQDWKDSYPSGYITDPTGPSRGEDRVYRGGSRGDFARGCRSAYRESGTPDGGYEYVGFRLLRTF
ncbi:MAG: SUMF1/EgtB/PvdO family nonheme iron enzyme [Desulfobacterales bacterium]|nr:SUMF1/EgtB/PvdO family nonheme iron enzyme [Desulfobacterales bacterium]MBF0396255.1 SUMF1/EgtB/PvdO family nonheme iron enzyme [Desulfobacterales bacterium]